MRLQKELFLEQTADEGICMRKVSDVSNYSVDSNCSSGLVEPSEKVMARKISDVSIHSGEGLSSKLSDISKDSGTDQEQEAEKQWQNNEQLRKVSASSSDGNVDGELTELRKVRAGSVSKAVEKYDTLTRQRHRRSGLPTCMTQFNADSQTTSTSS